MREDHLLVDYAGVIGHHQLPEDLQAMAAILNRTQDEFERTYWLDRAAYDMGLDDLAYWSDVAGRALDPETVVRLVELDLRSWTRLNTRTVEVLHEAHRAGRRLTLLSNAPTFLARAVRAMPELSFFGTMVFSCELEIAKPDPNAFLRALDAGGALPGKTVFIDDRDDRDENIVAAETLGIRGVHFESAEGLAQSLRDVSQTS